MTWIIVLVIAAGTYLIRASMLTITDRQPPRQLATRLALVAPAALGALTVSALSHDTDVAVIAAGAAGFAVVRRTGNINHALIIGFPTLWLLTAITR